jgi:hypothetical protein
MEIYKYFSALLLAISVFEHILCQHYFLRAKQARESCQPRELPQQNHQLSGQTNKDKPAQQK